MSAALQQAAPSGDASLAPSTPLRAQLIRPIVLFIGGFTIAFTGAYHSDLGFDRLLAAIVFVIIAAATVIDWRIAPEGARPRIMLVAAVISVAAAIMLAFDLGVSTFAAILAAWGVMTSVCDYLVAKALPAQRGDRVFLSVIALLMSALILVFMNDPIAAIGFFGAYLVIAGVFLTISVIDMHAKAKREAETAATTDSASADPAASTHQNESTV